MSTRIVDEAGEERKRISLAIAQRLRACRKEKRRIDVTKLPSHLR